MTDLINSIISNNAFLGAVFSSVSIILIGYFLVKTGKVREDAGKALSTILLQVALPALAFNAFLVPINEQTFKTGMNVFIFGFIAYVLLIIISKIMYGIGGYRGDRKMVLETITIFGSTTFFGIPIISAVLGSEGTLFANIFNIAYRVFLYTYGYVVMSGVKFKKENFKQIFINPIVIATFVGLFIWIFQGSMPQVIVKTGEATMQVGILRLDQTLPWFQRAIAYLGGLSSPLAWLAIGMTLAKISLKQAASEKDVWVYSVAKVCVVPALFLILMITMNAINVLPLSYEAIAGIIIMLATPPATVAVAYAISFNKDEVFASNCSLLGTVAAVIAVIVWVIVLVAMHSVTMI